MSAPIVYEVQIVAPSGRVTVWSQHPDRVSAELEAAKPRRVGLFTQVRRISPEVAAATAPPRTRWSP